MPAGLPSASFKELKTVLLELPCGTSYEKTIANIKTLPKGLALKFEGIETPEDADLLRGASLKIDSDLIPPLPEGHYYYHEIIGLNVINMAGEVMGTISEILGQPSSDVYVVKSGDKEYLIPVVENFVKEINLNEGHVRVNPVEGLFD